MRQTTISQLESFCREALRLLGVSMRESGPGALEVLVPPERLDLFEGRERIRLVFDPVRAGEEAELVAPGSFALERLLAAVRQRGSLAHYRLKASAEVPAEPPLKVENGDARPVSSRRRYHALLTVWFAVSLVSDEDREDLRGVTVDLATGKASAGTPSVWPDRAVELEAGEGEDIEVDLAAGFQAARVAAEASARQWAEAAQEESEQRLSREIERLNGYYDDMRADAASGSRSRDVRQLQKNRDRAALAYGKLEQIYEAARGHLESEAGLGRPDESNRIRRKQMSFGAQIDLHHKSIQVAQEIMARSPPEGWIEDLERVKAAALEGFTRKAQTRELARFAQETADLLRETALPLEAEQVRRIGELEERFQIKAVVRPVSALLVRTPRLERGFTAVSGPVSVPFTAAYDLATGQVVLPACPQCGGPMRSAYVCAGEHLVCPACRRACAGCGKDLCVSCAGAACQVCGAAACETCRAACTECGKSVCPAHATCCHACQKKVCRAEERTGCARPCALCGDLFCREHIRECPVCRQAACEADMQACTECGAAACREDVPDCPGCGKAVCRQHSAPCRFCGQSTCAACADREGYCRACASLFPATASAKAIAQIVSELSPARLTGRERWFIAENDRQFILARAGRKLEIYLLEKSPCRLKGPRTLGWLASLKEKIRLGRS
ncbi:MAG: hypothetical protein IT210_16025 [Armatimonadetes bacterium]|nr:hypothetical protein [Armatimonadota bacterium]